jgi:alkaline phosphatase
MNRIVFLFFACVIVFSANAQQYTSAAIFAHNDYVHSDPFHGSYKLKVGYIEADIFLQDNQLMVAHTLKEMDKNKTLENLYLMPLEQEIKKNKGFAYADEQQTLMLMIDLKTEGKSTLTELVSQLKKHPVLTSCKTLEIVISGNVPDPNTWIEYPEFIHFDGRPAINYTDDQLKRISMISNSFAAYSKWKGTETMSEADRNKITQLINEIHSKGKKIRFWATPDNQQSWPVLMELQMDMLVTDDVKGLLAFISRN